MSPGKEPFPHNFRSRIVRRGPTRQAVPDDLMPAELAAQIVILAGLIRVDGRLFGFLWSDRLADPAGGDPP